MATLIVVVLSPSLFYVASQPYLVPCATIALFAENQYFCMEWKLNLWFHIAASRNVDLNKFIKGTPRNKSDEGSGYDSDLESLEDEEQEDDPDEDEKIDRESENGQNNYWVYIPHDERRTILTESKH